MTEMYFFNVIGSLSNLFAATWIAALCVIGFSLIFAPLIYDVVVENDCVSECKKVCKTIIAVLVISAIGDVVTPSTKEMYAIYGVGNIIDYIESNDKAKQLPDKCIDALTRLADSIEQENKDNNN